MSREDELRKILASGTVKQCMAFFDGMREADRVQYEPIALESIDGVSGVSVLDRSYNKPAFKRRKSAAVCALVATTSPEGMARRYGWLFEQDLAILTQRPRTWVQQFVDMTVAKGVDRVGYMLPIIAKGYCDPPEHEHYVFGLISHIVDPFDMSSKASKLQQLTAALRDHTAFREEHLWLCFDPSAPEEATRGHGRWFYQDAELWAAALQTLCNEGIVDRARLLDAPLHALAQDATPHQGPRFGPFHDALKPTIEERQQRLPLYLQLLGCTTRTTVAFALKALTTLAKKGRLPATTLLEHIEPTLTHKTKNIVSPALRLLAMAHRDAPEHGEQIALLVATALLHDMADVQQSALDLLSEIYPDTASAPPRVKESIRQNADFIKPSLQSKFAMWFDSAAPTEETAPTTGLPSEPVVPIANPEELVLELSALLADGSDAIAFERVLDGLYRLSDQELDLKAIYKQSTKAIYQGELRFLIASMILEWHDGPASEWPTLSQLTPKFDLEGFLIRALREATAGLGTARVRLCTPTNHRGEIDSDELVTRALATPGQPYDQVLSLLRLRTTPASKYALKRAKEVDGEYGAALRYALGETPTKANLKKICQRDELWVAAARARHPWGNDELIQEVLGDTDPGGTQIATYTFAQRRSYPTQTLTYEPEPPAQAPPLKPLVLLHTRSMKRRARHDTIGYSIGIVRYAATVHPANLEALFAHGYCCLDIDWWEAQWHVRSYLEPMLFADCKLGPNAHRLLAVGLAAKEAGQWGIAVDVMVTAATDGRLSIDMLGTAMAELFSSGIAGPGRWARSLAEVARVSSKHRDAAIAVTCSALRGDPANAPKGIAKLLEFLHEACVEADSAITDNEARSYLDGLTTGGKTAKLKKAILALEA